MPSKENTITNSPLEIAERAHRTSSSSLDADRGGISESQGFLRPRWECQQSAHWRILDRLSNSLWFHSILIVANLVLFGIAVYVNSKSLRRSPLDSHHAACMTDFPQHHYKTSREQVANVLIHKLSSETLYISRIVTSTFGRSTTLIVL